MRTFASICLTIDREDSSDSSVEVPLTRAPCSTEVWAKTSTPVELTRFHTPSFGCK